MENESFENIKIYSALSHIFYDESSKRKNIDTETKAYFKKVKNEKSILSIDILGYSQYEDYQQIVIPYLFKLLYDKTINQLLATERYFFTNLYEELQDRKRFIDSGDGGFIILDLPIQSILFSIYFEKFLNEFNSQHKFKNIRKVIGLVKVRYAITFDAIVYVEELKNYYGSAIINAARIISRDTLDRCLCDENTYKWFIENLTSFENLNNLSFNEIKKLIKINNPQLWDEKIKSLVFPEEKYHRNGINFSSISKIGELKIKKNLVSVYSIYIQNTFEENIEKDINSVVVALGNLNTFGIQNSTTYA
ncbi:hypothetical protein CLV96_4028 [Leptospira meyeri]|uniref:Guanylate cyclase domain-containing protein n=1 Tax=Leptospira meyeri TaxID=29508 RepID=A0A4R8MI72_LEPME|nr:hypothetical protein [Leptospira meyeri]EKJ88724.1 hypothetical protein LEP1GSC017_3973 [Leptospira meyeri serovar Hardjo str. Went 5]TDY65844.1 hypothetical protein CLV96_4028 [Leptospira meyeri]